MAETRLSFSEIGITTSSDPKRKVLRYPVLWIRNPKTGRCNRYNQFELKDEITKKNFQGIAESADFVLIVTTAHYYSFSSSDGKLITKAPKDEIKGVVVGVQAEGVLLRNDRQLILMGKDLKPIATRDLTQDEINHLDDLQ